MNCTPKVSLLYVRLIDHHFQELFILHALYFEIKQRISHSSNICPLNTNGEVTIVPGYFVPFFGALNATGP